MGAPSEIIIAALSTSGSVAALTGVIQSWLQTRKRKKEQEQKKVERLSIRLSGGAELSIRIDKATPKEIDDFIAAFVETGDGHTKGEQQAEPEALA